MSTNFRLNQGRSRFGLTSGLLHLIEIVAEDEARITVCPPYFQPVNIAVERVEAGVKRQAILVLPLVMLIYAPHIITTGCPEEFALQTICSALAD